MKLVEINQDISKPDISSVLVAVCTYKRPKMLADAITSIKNLIVPDGVKVEVLVVDNDVESSAKTVVQELQEALPFRVHYVVEGNRGISNARNRLLEESINLDASHILLFDDDELLTPNILQEQFKLYNSVQNAFIISGPTPSKFDDSYPNYIKKHMLFKQRTTKKTGLLRDNSAAGNVFFPVSVAKDFGLRFSSEYVFMGGEDGDFFSKASKLGFNIVWCNEAVIQEVVPPARATISYVLKKCYYNGYAGAYAKFKSNNKFIKKILYVIKTLFVFALSCLLIFPSLIFGLTGFFNTLGIASKTLGKIFGATKNVPYNFYQVVYGE